MIIKENIDKLEKIHDYIQINNNTIEFMKEQLKIVYEKNNVLLNKFKRIQEGLLNLSEEEPTEYTHSKHKTLNDSPYESEYIYYKGYNQQLLEQDLGDPIVYNFIKKNYNELNYEAYKNQERESFVNDFNEFANDNENEELKDIAQVIEDEIKLTTCNSMEINMVKSEDRSMKDLYVLNYTFIDKNNVEQHDSIHFNRLNWHSQTYRENLLNTLTENYEYINNMEK